MPIQHKDTLEERQAAMRRDLVESETVVEQHGTQGYKLGCRCDICCEEKRKQLQQLVPEGGWVFARPMTGPALDVSNGTCE